MAVVEQQAPERMPPSTQLQLGLGSLLGAVLVMFCVSFVLGGLPTLWETMFHVSEDVAAGRLPVLNEFLSSALLLMLMIAVGAALAYLLRQIELSSARPGLRVGVLFGVIAIYLVLGLITKLGWTMTAEGVTVVIGAAMALGVFWLFTRLGFAGWLIRFENQGWFHAISYKGNQGVRVRRGTIIALLAVGVCGIISLVSHRSLGTSRLALNDWRPNDWNWDIPFTKTDAGEWLYVPIMHEVHITVPLLLALASLWVAWRVVNWPTFADFLIATEAEINKVSWTTRRRLMQDTVVVLITVFLFTAFLFVVDIIWIKVLTNPWIQVLQVDIKSEFQKQQEKTQW